MATTIFTPLMLRGVGTRGVPSILKSGGGGSFSDTTSFRFDGTDESFTSSTNFTCLDGQAYVGISFWVKIPDVSAETSYILEIDNEKTPKTWKEKLF